MDSIQQASSVPATDRAQTGARDLRRGGQGHLLE